MPDPNLTVGELFKAKAVTDEQVNAAVEAYLTDLQAGRHAIASGYVVDLDAAVVQHPWATLVVANEDAGPAVDCGGDCWGCIGEAEYAAGIGEPERFVIEREIAKGLRGENGEACRQNNTRAG